LFSTKFKFEEHLWEIDMDKNWQQNKKREDKVPPFKNIIEIS